MTIWQVLGASLRKGHARIAINSGANYDAEQFLNLTAQAATTAPYTPVAVGAHTGAPTGNYIQIGAEDPSALGWWRISIDAMLGLAGTTTDVTALVDLYQHTSTNPTSGGTMVRSWRASEYTENGLIRVLGEYLVYVDAESPSPKFSLRNGSPTFQQVFSTQVASLVTVIQLTREDFLPRLPDLG